MTTNTELDLFGLLFFDKYYKKSIIKKDFKLYNDDIYYQIINIGTSVGTHWVCIIKVYNNVYYYDSFGVNSFQKLIDECDKTGYNLYYNVNKDQGIDEINCGERCLYNICEMNKILFE
ncbi:hypothetical protein CBEVV_008 [Choristoneura biennis entomopoxvirus 'L' virophage]|nr:hypothetical protein CBEVV_008 [Choristoneura biennis entomopoxvirus 'L' virophage]